MIVLLCTIILLLSLLVNFIQFEFYLGGIAVFYSLLAAQFVYQEYFDNSQRLAIIIISIWSLIIAYLVWGMYSTGHIDALIDGSHNHVNTLLLPFFIITSCVMAKIKKGSGGDRFKIALKPLFLLYLLLSIISLGMSLLLTGRIGLVLGAVGILVICFVLLNKSIFSFFLFFFFIYFIFTSIDEIILFMQVNSEGMIKLFSVVGSEDIRFDILKHWISMLPDIGTWFGVPNKYFLNNFGVGSHNSIIQIYETFGMFGLMFFSALVIYSFIAMLFKRRYLLFLLFAMLGIRAFSDSVFNSGGILTVFWFLIFSAGNNRFNRSILNIPRHS